MSSTTRIGPAPAVLGTPASIRSNGTVTAAIYRPLFGPPSLRRGSSRVLGPLAAYSTSCPLRAQSASGEKLCRCGCRGCRRVIVLVLLRLERPARPPAPVLPGPVDAVGAGARGDLVHLAGGEKLDLAHVHGLFLQPRIDLEIDGNVDGMPDVPARHGCAMPPHQCGAAGADQLGEIAAHVHVLDQQRGIPKMVM